MPRGCGHTPGAVTAPETCEETEMSDSNVPITEHHVNPDPSCGFDFGRFGEDGTPLGPDVIVHFDEIVPMSWEAIELLLANAEDAGASHAQK